MAERLTSNDGDETSADQQDEDVSARADGQMEKADEGTLDLTESDGDGRHGPGPVKAATLCVSELY